MKFSRISSTLGLAVLLIFSSCSVEKRLYNRGLSIDWLDGKHGKNKQVMLSRNKMERWDLNQSDVQPKIDADSFALDEGFSDIESIKHSELFLSPLHIVGDKDHHQNSNKKKANYPTVNDTDKCDLIILKNGERMYAKILSIENEVVQYIYCDSIVDGQIWIIKSSEVEQIKYSKVISPNTSKYHSKATSPKKDNQNKGAKVAIIVVVLLVTGIILLPLLILFAILSLFL